MSHPAAVIVNVPTGDAVHKEHQTSVPKVDTQLATTTPMTTTMDPPTTALQPTTVPATTKTTTVAAAAKTRSGLHRVRDTGQKHKCSYSFPPDLQLF